MEFAFVIGFLEHLQIVTTSIYSTITNSHNLQSTTERASSVCYAFTSDHCFRVPVLTDWQLTTTQQLLFSLTFQNLAERTPDNEVEVEVTINSQSASLSWRRAPIWNP
jgi:hypothetical protein